MSYTEEYKQQVSESAARVAELLQDLDSSKNKEKLRGELQTIISASRLEDHPEIAGFVDHIKNIVDALIAGTITPSGSTNNALKLAVQEIESNLEGRRQGIDQGLAEELKAILKNKKIEERDYIFLKKIRALYVDEDKFAHHNVKKVAGKSIDIESCFTGKEALSFLKNDSFDVVMCELKLPDMNAFDIFKEFSSKVPIVAISSSEDAKLVQLATKAGAMDFIVKNDAGIKWIPRSLHTVTNEWKKRAKASDKKLMLDDPYARKLLKEMMKSGSPVKQQLDSKMAFSGVGFSDAGKDYSKILESLVAAGFVVKQPSGLTPACPECKSVNIVPHYVCQNCSKSDFTRGDILEHNKCGHTDFERSFRSGDKLVCPKCRKELKLIGVDYYKIEAACRCNSCGNVFAAPDQKFTCSGCGHSNFKISQAAWVQLQEYFLSQSRIAELKLNIASLEPLQEFLADRGYKIMVDHRVETKYQIFGPFDLVAQKGDRQIFVIVLGANVEENFAKAVELDTMEKVVDYRIAKFAVIFSEPREVTRNLADKFDINLIFAENEDKVVEKFKEQFFL